MRNEASKHDGAVDIAELVGRLLQRHSANRHILEGDQISGRAAKELAVIRGKTILLQLAFARGRKEKKAENERVCERETKSWQATNQTDELGPALRSCSEVKRRGSVKVSSFRRTSCVGDQRTDFLGFFGDATVPETYLRLDLELYLHEARMQLK